MTSAFDIHPLTPDRWPDFETVLGRGGIGGCWCMHWVAESSVAFQEGCKGGSTGSNRAAFRGLVAKSPPGLLAYHGAEPVGWVRVMPRARHKGLARSRLYPPRDLPDELWSISCFVVRRAWRGRGLTEALIRAAITHARREGAKVLEAYPNAARHATSAMALYRGHASTFRRLGFHEVARNGRDKPLMRLALR